MSARDMVEQLLIMNGAKKVQAVGQETWVLKNGMYWRMPTRSTASEKVVEGALNSLRLLTKPVITQKRDGQFKKALQEHNRKKFFVKKVQTSSGKPVEVAGGTTKRITRSGRGRSLSSGFVEKANQVLREKGAKAAKTFIKTKRDIYSL